MEDATASLKDASLLDAASNLNQAMQLLDEKLVARSNLYCYGQVESPYGSGEYIRSLESEFGANHETLILSEIPDRDGIYDSIRLFLGTGK